MALNFNNYDLEQDLESYAKRQLDGFGIIPSKNQKPLIQYLHLCFKYIEPLPRAVYCSSHFVVPTENEGGFLLLKEGLRTGLDITPFLSIQIKKPEDRNGNLNVDGLLTDFGIYHFHLNAHLGEHDHDHDFVKRSEYLALAFVMKDEVYFIKCKPHGVDAWNGQDVMQILHDEFPHLIEPFKSTNSSAVNPLNDNERTNLRKKNLNSEIQVTDGTVYCSPGLGFVANGQPAKVVVESVIVKALLEDQLLLLKSFLEEELDTNTSDTVELQLVEIIPKFLDTRHTYDTVYKVFHAGTTYILTTQAVKVNKDSTLNYTMRLKLIN